MPRLRRQQTVEACHAARNEGGRREEIGVVGMFSYREAQWHWNGQPLDLVDPEPALLLSMLREQGVRRQPYVWLARALTQPFSPATGRAFLATLRRKLEWAGAPEGVIAWDILLGAMIPSEIPRSDDAETAEALGLPRDERRDMSSA